MCFLNLVLKFRDDIEYFILIFAIEFFIQEKKLLTNKQKEYLDALKNCTLRFVIRTVHYKKKKSMLVNKKS